MRQRRSEGWFTDLYAEHYPHVVRYAVRRLASPDAAGELAQEVFIVAWRRRGDVPDRALPWLYGVARRLLANHWRGRRAAATLIPLDGVEPPAHPDPDPGHAGDRLADVRAALARLSDSDQEILRLIAWEELSLPEAAVVLGCTRATAAVRLHRARRRLTDALSQLPTRPVKGNTHV